MKKRKDKIHSWFMDMNLLLGYWGADTRTYHHTAPTNSLFALHEALLLIREEGLENAWARHTRHHLALKAGLEAMGLQVPGEGEVPAAADERRHCPEGVERGRGAQHAAQRVQPRDRRRPRAARRQDLALRPDGLLAAAPDNVMLCLSALGSVLSDMGMPVHVGDAEAAAHGAYAQMHVKDAQRKKRAA